VNWDFQPGLHPDADQLSVFVEGVTTAREHDRMLAHLAECAKCRKAVFLMEPHEEPQRATATPVKGWVWRWLVPVGLPAAALACVLLAVFVYIRPRGTTPSTPQQIASSRQAETESPKTLAAPSSDSKQGAPATNAGAANINSEPGARSEGRPYGLATKATTNAPPRESQMASGSNLSPSKSPPMTAKVEPPQVLSPAPSPVTIGGPIRGVAVEAGKGSGGGIGSGTEAGTALRMQASQAAGQNRSVQKKDLPALQNQTSQDEALVAVSGTLAGVSGRITDQSGAVVAGATVTLRDGNGKTRQTTTGTDGSFHLTELPAGQYEMTATASGFKTSKQSIELKPSELAMLQPKLDVGTASETVEVTAASPVINSESASVNGTVTEKESASLAMNGRNLTQLLTLQPGTVTVSHGKRFLSLDGAGNLFLSHDKGKEWKKVNPQWAGKAVRIELAPAAANGPAFQMTTDAGAIWTSKDGTHWHRQ
jgi:Carboxypeptidase regulatory-like domain/Putative zinc-finger